MRRTIKILTILSILLMLVTVVNANSAKLGVSSPSKLKAGEKVTINVNLTNIDAGDGVGGFFGILNYDADIFEPVLESDFSGVNNWTVQGYNSNNGRFTLTRDTDFSEGGTILTISLTVKEEITATSTKVSVSSATTTDGQEDIQLGTASVTIKSEAAASSESPTPTQSSSAPVKDLTTAGTKKIPQTGIVSYEVLGIAVVAVIGIASFAIYKKMSKEVK